MARLGNKALPPSNYRGYYRNYTPVSYRLSRQRAAMAEWLTYTLWKAPRTYSEMLELVEDKIGTVPNGGLYVLGFSASDFYALGEQMGFYRQGKWALPRNHPFYGKENIPSYREPALLEYNPSLTLSCAAVERVSVTEALKTGDTITVTQIVTFS